jgi:hypothetical protein
LGCSDGIGNRAGVGEGSGHGEGSEGESEDGGCEFHGVEFNEVIWLCGIRWLFDGIEEIVWRGLEEKREDKVVVDVC